ncbi:MAG: hypothetical protein ACRCZ2_10135 [Fusobacteriaceae bacterium]
MFIEEVIQSLEEIRKKSGNIQVHIRNDWHSGEVKVVKEIDSLGKVVIELRGESFYFNDKVY